MDTHTEKLEGTPQDRVIIFDTTLRDGEQALRASLSRRAKLELAHAIARLNVDVMEVGFPVSSPEDFMSVQEIANQVRGPRICGLARAVENDIIQCANALKSAEQSRIHTFIATSPIHLKHKLRMSLEQAKTSAIGSIKLARQYCDDVEFSCEDAARTPIDDLCFMVDAAIEAGARTINLPDTVGYTTPQEYAFMIEQLRNRVPNIDKAILSVHCHNDLGLAVANSMAAIQAGARQIECTVNGIGERAGNCSLEEVAMIINTRKDLYNLSSGIKTQEIVRTSHQVAQICNMPVQANKAIVGDNAFAHSSGIHQDGVLKAENTYEIIKPSQVGIKANELNLTSRSGRHVIAHRLTTLGYSEQEYDLDQFYQQFLNLADKKGAVYDYDLEALMYNNLLEQADDHYQLSFLNTTTTTNQVSSATVALRMGDQSTSEAATGNGPVEATYKAINRITNTPLNLVQYQLSAKGEGESAIGQVDIVVESAGQRYHGAGLATDIVEASAKAYINVLNLLHRAEQIEQAKQQNVKPTQTSHQGVSHEA